MTIDAPIPARLLNGAKVLGKLWRDNIRCAGGWSVRCPCQEKTPFCKAKDQWLTLAVQEGREWNEDAEFAFIEVMSVAEFKASGLTMALDIPDVGTVKVGPAGEVAVDAMATMDGEGLKTVLAIVKSFPGSKVVSDQRGEK